MHIHCFPIQKWKEKKKKKGKSRNPLHSVWKLLKTSHFAELSLEKCFFAPWKFFSILRFYSIKRISKNLEEFSRSEKASAKVSKLTLTRNNKNPYFEKQASNISWKTLVNAFLPLEKSSQSCNFTVQKESARICKNIQGTKKHHQRFQN